MILQPDSNSSKRDLELVSDPQELKVTLSREPITTYKGPIVLAIHGGAGGTTPLNMPPEMEEAYRSKLRDSLNRGYAVLSAGGTALDAACAAVVEMEDSPLFNAGKGAVFNSSGENECEASVMLSGPPLPSIQSSNDERSPKDPKDKEQVQLNSSDNRISPSRRAAAVTLVRETKNPILLAKALYEHPNDNPHVLIAGRNAEEIGWKLGCEKVEKNYYWTKRRWLEHRRGLGLPDEEIQEEGPEKVEIPEPPRSTISEPPSYSSLQTFQDTINSITSSSEIDLNCLPQGTVGAVALDSSGRLACSTSTGGKTNKLKGRVGDTPTLGSGFWSEIWESDHMMIPSVAVDDVSKEQDSEESCYSQLVNLFCLRSTSNSNSTKPEDEESSLKTSTWIAPSKLKGVALSGTGDGDYFLRISFASLVSHRMRFLSESSEVAGRRAVEELTRVGGKGTGGAIVLDLEGKVSFPLNSATMNRGFVSSNSGAVARVAIFHHEECS